MTPERQISWPFILLPPCTGVVRVLCDCCGVSWPPSTLAHMTALVKRPVGHGDPSHFICTTKHASETHMNNSLCAADYDRPPARVLTRSSFPTSRPRFAWHAGRCGMNTMPKTSCRRRHCEPFDTFEPFPAETAAPGSSGSFATRAGAGAVRASSR